MGGLTWGTAVGCSHLPISFLAQQPSIRSIGLCNLHATCMQVCHWTASPYMPRSGRVSLPLLTILDRADSTVPRGRSCMVS